MQDAKGLTVKSTSAKTLVKRPLSRGIQLQSLAMAGLIVGQVMIVNSAVAAPVGGVVTGGSGSISANGLATTINQKTARLAIDWQSFNVDVNESVKFVQPSSSAFVLNKILDQNPSSIRGSIEANGNVLLLNPRGIMFTESATINVGGLMASGLNIDTADFMNGDFIFDGVEDTSGTVVNSGIINASSVALLGKQVANEAGAVITAEVVSLSAGDSAVLTFDSDGMMGVQVTKAVLENDLGVDAAVLNDGTVNGQQVLLQASTSEDLFSKAVNNTGIIRAKGIDTSGGSIRLIGSGGAVSANGTLDASGMGGGSIHIEGAQAVVGGAVSVDGAAGTGGTIAVLGDQVEISATAQLSASGESGGGEVLIGGDYQGANASVRNASHTTVAAGAEIRASGIDSGGGGKVIVWADDTTIFYGHIDASSGLINGDGGFVETSGKQDLIVSGRVVARGASGKNGLWLLDPDHMIIGDIAVPETTVDVESIIDSLEADTDISFTTVDGDITLASAIQVDGPGQTDATLTLDSGNNLIIDNVIEGVGNRDKVTLVLSAKSNIDINANVTTQDGHVTLTADSDGDGAGDLTIASGVSVLTGDPSTNGVSGNIALSAVNFVNNGTVSNAKGSGTEGSLTIDADTIDNQGSIVAANTDVVVNVGTHGGGSNTLGSIEASSVTVSALGTADQFQFVADTAVSFLANTDLSVNRYAISGAEVVNIASGGNVTAGAASETFSVLGSGSLDITTADGTVRFNGVDSVDAGTNGVDPDHIVADADWLLKGFKSVEVESITFSNVEAASGTGASSTIVGQNSIDEVFTITDKNDISVDGVAFNNVTDVEGGDTDTDTIIGDSDWSLIGEKAVSDGHISFVNVDAVTATGASSTVVGQNSVNETFTIVDVNDVAVEGIAFNNITEVDGGDTDSDTVTGNTDWTLSGPKTVSDGNINFTQVDLVTATGGSSAVVGGADWSLGGAKSASADGVSFNNITEVTAAGASTSITGRDGVDENFSITDTNDVSVDSIAFNNIDSVDGGTSDSDTVTGNTDWTLSGAKAVSDGNINFTQVDVATATGSSSAVAGGADWTLDGAKSASADGVSFNNITEVTAAGANTSITGRDGVDENFSITDTNDVSVDSIAFNNIDSVDGGTSDSDTVTGNTDWTLSGTKAVSDGNINFTQLDVATATGSSSAVAGGADWSLGGAKSASADGVSFNNITEVTAAGASTSITGRDGVDEDFSITDSNDVSVEGIAFNNIDSVDGGASDSDTLTGDSNWALRGLKSVSDGHIDFAQVDVVTATGTVSSIAGQGSVNEIYTVTDEKDVSVDGMFFNNITSVDGGAADNDTVMGDTNWALNGAKSVSDGNISFTQIDVVTATGVVSSLTGQDSVDETFAITDTNDISVQGIAFNNITSVAGGVNDSDTVTGDSGWSLSGPKTVSDGDISFTQVDRVTATGGTSAVAGGTEWLLEGPKSASAHGVVFDNITEVTATGASTSLTGRDGVDDSFSITDESDVSVEGISFNNIRSVDGGATDSDTVTGDSNWSLIGSKAVSDGHISFTQVDVVTATGASSRVSGRDGVNETFIITDEKDVNVEGLAFNNITSVDGGEMDSDTVSGDSNWSLQGEKALSDGHISFSQVDVVSAIGSSSSLSGQDGVNETFEITDVKDVSVEGIAFNNITSIDGGDTDSDTVSGDSDWTLSGPKAVSDGNVSFTQVDIVTVSGSTSAVTGGMDWVLGGAKNASAHGVEFNNITEVTASGANTSLSGQDNIDETFTIIDENDVSVAGITFNNIIDVDGGSADSDTVMGDSNWSLNGEKAVSDGHINFSAVDVVTATGVSSSVTGQDGTNETFTIIDDYNVNVEGISFNAITSVDGGETDSDTVTGDSNWSLTGNKAVSDGHIDFTNVDLVVATGTQSVVSDQDAVIENFEITASQSVSVAGIGFSGITEIQASANDVLTDVGSFNYILFSSNSVNVADIDFSGFDIAQFDWGALDTLGISGDHLLDGQSFDANGALLVGSTGNDQFTLLGANNVRMISGADVRATPGEVTFTNVIAVDGLGSSAVGDLVEGSSSWQLNGANSVIAELTTFSNIERVGTSGVTSSILGQAALAETFTVNGNESVNVDGIQFSGINQVNAGSGAIDSVSGSNQWQLNGTQSVRSQGVAFSNVDRIGALSDGSTVTGQDLVAETFTALAAETLSVDGMTFYGVDTVRAGNGPVDDTVLGLTNWQLAGNEQLDVLGIDFEQINIAGASGVNSILTGRESSDDVFTVLSNNTVMSDGITFLGVQTVNAGGSSSGDHVVGGGTYTLLGLSKFSTGLMTFNDVNQVGQFGDNSTVIGEADVGEHYTMNGLESFNVDTIDFIGVGSVQAGSGAVTDTVSGALQWQLVGSNRVSAQGVEFDQIETVGLIGENYQLTGRAGVVDGFGVSGSNEINTLGIDFVGIGFVVGEANDVVNDTGNVTYELRHSSEAVVNNVAISGIDLSTYNWSAGDFLGVTQNHQFSGQVVDSKGATILSSVGDDTFAIIGSGQLNYSRGDFTGSGSGVVGFSNVTHVGSDDGVSDTDSVIGSSVWNLRGSNAVHAQDIEFSNIDVVGEVGVASQIVARANVSETFTVLGSRHLWVDGVQFLGTDQVVAGDSAGIIDSVIGASSWNLMGSNSFSSAGVTFSGIEQAGQVGVASTLNGSDTLGESFSITGNQMVNTLGIDFSGVSRINAGDSAGDSIVGSTVWTLLPDGAVSTQNINIYEFEAAGSAGDNAQLLGSTGISEAFEIVGHQQVLVNGVTFSGVDNLVAGNSAGDEDSIVGSNSWLVTGDERLSQAGIDIEQIELAGLAGSDATVIVTTGFDEDYDVFGTEQVSVSGIAFSGVTTVNAGVGSDGDRVLGANQYSLLGSERISAENISFNDIERVGLVGESSFVVGRNDVREEFVITGIQAFDVDDVAFTGVASVAAGSGSVNDSVAGASSWNLLGQQSVKGASIDFSQIELVGTSGDIATLVGRDNIAETYVVPGAGLVHVEGMEFSGIANVNGGEGNAVDTVEGPTSWTLLGQNSVFAEGMTFTQIEQAGLVGDNGDLLGRDGLQDSFVINGDYALSSSGVSFIGVATLDAGDLSGEDSVTGASSWSLQGSESVRANLITFSNIETVGIAGDGSQLVGQDSVAEDYELLSGQSLRVNDIVFDGVTTVSAGGVAGVDTAFGASEWELQGSGNVRGNSISFTGVDSYGQAGDDSHLIGQAAIGEHYEILAPEIISVSGTQFSGVATIAAGNGAGQDSVSGASQWTLKGTQSVEAQGIDFSEIELVGLNGENNGLIGQSGVNEVYALGSNRAVTVAGMTLRGVTEISAGSGDTDTVVGLDNEQWVLHDLDTDSVNETLEAQGIEMIGMDAARSTGGATLTTTDNDEDFSVAGSIIEVSDIEFQNLVEVNAGGGSDRVVNAVASQWATREQGGAVQTNSLQGVVNSVAVIFSDIEAVSNAGVVSGSDFNTDYVLTGADSLELANVTISGVTELRAGSANDRLVGVNLDATWNINNGSGNLDNLVFSGFESFQAGSGRDTFNVTAGNAGEIFTGGGDDVVNLSGGSAIGVYLEDGNDQVFLTSELSLVDRFDGGAGTDSLSSSLADETWVISNPISGVNRLGAMEFTRIENLYNTSESLSVESALSAVFSPSSIQFSNGISLGYKNSGNISFASSYGGSNGITGAVTADRLEITAQTDVELETDINTLGITAVNGTSIDVSVSELDDLTISKIDTGANGNLVLNSKQFGVLTAQSRGDLHITARDVTLGSTQQRWTNIGEQINPLRMDVSNTLNIVSLSYVNPEFVSQVPTVNATGERIESLIGVVASQGLKSAVQNQVVEFTQVDPAIFTDVRSYAVGLDAVYSPETRLVAGELIPTTATATGTLDQQEENTEIEE